MMGNINNLIEKLNDDHLEYIQNENENLDQWIIKIDRANPTKKLPKQFVDDLRKRFTIYWQRDHSTVVQEFPFFNQLPVNLRSELVDHMFRGFIDRFSVFFKDLEKQFTNAVVVNLYPKKYTQDNDTSDQRKQIDIIPIDTCPNDLFFITKGHIFKNGLNKLIHCSAQKNQLKFKNGKNSQFQFNNTFLKNLKKQNFQKTILFQFKVTIASKDGVHMYITLGPGSYFGDHLILFNLKSSNAFIAIDEDLECMCIDRKIFLDLCDFYPNSHKILKDKAYQRRKKFRETKEEVMLNEKMQTLRQKTSGNQFQANLNGTNLLQQNSNKNSNVNQLSFNQAIVERLMSPDINSNAQSPALQQRQTTSSNKIKKINSEYYYEGEENQNKKEQEINSSESSENNNETDRNQTNQIQKTETNIQQAEEKELKNKRLQKELDQVKQLQDQFNKSIKDNLQNLGSQIQNDQIEGSDNDDLQNFKIHEEEMKQNEILKLAKDLNDKIEILKKSICLLDSEIKTKISNIKTELEFVTSYEEVLHDFDENEITELNKN